MRVSLRPLSSVSRRLSWTSGDDGGAVYTQSNVAVLPRFKFLTFDLFGRGNGDEIAVNVIKCVLHKRRDFAEITLPRKTLWHCSAPSYVEKHMGTKSEQARAARNICQVEPAIGLSSGGPPPSDGNRTSILRGHSDLARKFRPLIRTLSAPIDQSPPSRSRPRSNKSPHPSRETPPPSPPCQLREGRVPLVRVPWENGVFSGTGTQGASPSARQSSPAQ